MPPMAPLRWRSPGNHSPDLVVTDMRMPVMDGAELIRRLRADPATAGIPILASTGDTDLAGGADVVASKSSSLRHLAVAADVLLKKGRDSLKLLPTGVAGLDLVLGGGLQKGSVVVLAGGPGTGKTILAQQICFARATAAHKCVYYTTVSEPHTKLVRHLEPFAFFDREALGQTVEYIHLGSLLWPRREDGLEPLVSEVVRKALDEEPAVVVIDSTKMLRDFADDRELRMALYDLTSRIAHTDTVLLLVGEYTPDELAGDVEFSLADGIIQLEYQAREPVDRRSLRVTKMRGISQRPGRHTFRIGPGGIEVFPRIETLIPDPAVPASGRVRTGIPGLDELMGGGPRGTDATLVTGPSGVGKTIFGLRWIAQGLEEGEHGLYVTFQDTPAQLTGWPPVSAGTSKQPGPLDVWRSPTSRWAVLTWTSSRAPSASELAEHPVSRVVLDSMAELVFAARESERFPAFMRSLVGLIRAAGSSAVVTSETAPYGITDRSLDGLMFLFDNVVDLRYIEQESQIGRALSVLKMRNSRHQTTLVSFTISDHGITIGEKLEGVTGRLGWTALRTQDGRHPGGIPMSAEPA